MSDESRHRGSRPRIMGILNVTPDSFSDGGRLLDPDALARQVERMVAEGADILDIGGESTRPGADPVSLDEELHRVVPAVQCARAITDLPISVDTTKAAVARAALEAGATMVNDISGVRMDPEMVAVLRDHQVPVVVMHMQGTPRDMQVDPRYGDVVEEILDFFRERLAWLEEQGVDRSRVILDPGIGFGKRLEHNLRILRSVGRFKSLGCPVLIGHSRKSFLGMLLDLPVEERDWATAVVSALCVLQGADILRVHDVGRTRRTITLVHSMTPFAAGPAC